MMRKFFGTIGALAIIAASAPAAHAQGFGQGYFDIGPVIGFGSVAGGGIVFGARAEKGIKPLENLGGGMLGIQGAFDYYSGDNSFGFGNNGFTVINIAATANYHFKMSDTKFDPFLGLGLGFESWSWDGCSGNLCDGFGSSGIFFVGRLGARYFFGEKMALYGDVGAGAATLNVGLMFKLK